MTKERRTGLQATWALGVWVAAAVAMQWLDGQVDLASLAMVLVMASALASLWLPLPAALAGAALGVLAFNWSFVPPRGSLQVDLRQHLLLLVMMAGVNTLIALLVASLRRQAERAQRHLREAEQLRTLGEALRDTPEPLTQAAGLREALATLGLGPVSLLLPREAQAAHEAQGPDARATRPGAGSDAGPSAGPDAGPTDTLPPTAPTEAELLLGEATADELAGLHHCWRQRQAMGPGTGRHESLAAWYLPLRGRASSHGAALLRLPQHGQGDPLLCRHAQALCDQMGQALQRVATQADEARAREQAQLQAVRNAMLAAISHDFRTPLATILGAASSLQEQGERLAPEQRRRLAGSIVDEIRRLGRLTDNTLQLARLDAPGLVLQRDWESAEEVVGEVMRRTRSHDPQRRLRARLEPGLPLLHADALLLAQLLDNLVDNALKYSPAEAPVEIVVRRLNQQVLFAVRDRGPGVPPAWRERIFEVFERGESNAAAQDSARPGAGVGLAVCRAIARAHGSELRLRSRGHGGCSFEFALAIEEPPQ